MAITDPARGKLAGKVSGRQREVGVRLPVNQAAPLEAASSQQPAASSQQASTSVVPCDMPSTDCPWCPSGIDDPINGNGIMSNSPAAAFKIMNFAFKMMNCGR